MKNLKEELELLKPKLEQTIWPPMTYMLIPSVLKHADEVIENYSDAELSNDEQKLLEELIFLRKNFKRESIDRKED